MPILSKSVGHSCCALLATCSASDSLLSKGLSGSLGPGTPRRTKSDTDILKNVQAKNQYRSFEAKFSQTIQYYANLQNLSKLKALSPVAIIRNPLNELADKYEEFSSVQHFVDDVILAILKSFFEEEDMRKLRYLPVEKAMGIVLDRSFTAEEDGQSLKYALAGSNDMDNPGPEVLRDVDMIQRSFLALNTTRLETDQNIDASIQKIVQIFPTLRPATRQHLRSNMGVLTQLKNLYKKVNYGNIYDLSLIVLNRPMLAVGPLEVLFFTNCFGPKYFIDQQSASWTKSHNDKYMLAVLYQILYHENDAKFSPTGLLILPEDLSTDQFRKITDPTTRKTVAYRYRVALTEYAIIFQASKAGLIDIKWQMDLEVDFDVTSSGSSQAGVESNHGELFRHWVERFGMDAEKCGTKKFNVFTFSAVTVTASKGNHDRLSAGNSNPTKSTQTENYMDWVMQVAQKMLKAQE